MIRGGTRCSDITLKHLSKMWSKTEPLYSVLLGRGQSVMLEKTPKRRLSDQIPAWVMMWGLKPNSVTTAGASHPLTIMQSRGEPWKFKWSRAAAESLFSGALIIFKPIAELDIFEFKVIYLGLSAYTEFNSVTFSKIAFNHVLITSLQCALMIVPGPSLEPHLYTEVCSVLHVTS